MSAQTQQQQQQQQQQQNNKKIITVFGATGAQGGSVVQALLADGKFQVRGVTRNPSSEKSQALVKQGVEMVKADVNHPQQIKAAFAGAYGAFILTNFWDPSVGKNEGKVLQSLAQLSKQANLQHVVLSSLPNVDQISNGKYDVPHFTLKAEGATTFFELGVPVTRFEPAFYYQNFATFFPPQEQKGVVTYTFPPIAKLTAFDVSDSGTPVANAFNKPAQFIGKRILAGADIQPLSYYIQRLAKKSGKPTKLNIVSAEAFQKLAGSEIGQMLAYFNEFTYYGDAEPERLAQVSTLGLKSFATYLGVSDINLPVLQQ